MKMAKRLVIVVGAILALAACSFSDEVLWPTATGEGTGPESESGAQVVIAPSEGEQQQQQDLAGFPEPVTVAVNPAPLPTVTTTPLTGSAASTGTVVGVRVSELRGELEQLKRSVQAGSQELQQLRAQSTKSAQNYNASISDVRARLQVGTTPGNPEVIALWNQAQGRLDSVNTDIGPMTNLANKVNNHVTVAGFLLDSIRSSYSLAGGIDEDHRNLEKLEGDATEALQQADQMKVAINEEIKQQAAYVSSERQNMTSLALAIDKGHFLGGPSAGRSQIASAPPGGGQVASVAGRRPLVIIRFDRANINYEDALFSATSQALQRFPNAQFDLVAVSPTGGTQADQASSRGHAERVMRSLTGMGVPANRVTMSATSSATVSDQEVHIFVR
jgi:hypothetical protein